MLVESAPGTLEEVAADIFERRRPEGRLVGLTVFNLSKHDRNQLTLHFKIEAISAAA